MELGYFFFLMMFGVAGYLDHKEKKINDIIPAVLWVVSAATGYTWAFGSLILAFGTLFLINALTANIFKWHFFSWGDILLVPVFIFGASFIRNNAIVFPFIVVGVLAPIVMSVIKSRIANKPVKVAVAPVLFLFYMVAGIAYTLS